MLARRAPWLSVILLAWLGTSTQAQRPSRRGGDAVATPAGSERTIEHGGRTRRYVVRAPRALTRTSPAVPVVLVLHGGGGNAANAEAMTGFTALVERERIIVVYPDGSARRARVRLLTWNAGHCCGSAMEQRVDDVGFIAAVLDQLARDYPVDPKRVYVTGMSNGAMMTHRVGRELAPRIAAIAPVVGALFGDEPPSAGPVSLLAINGIRDKSVPVNGGATGGRSADAWDGTPTKPNLHQGTYWAVANECLPTPAAEERGQVVTWRHECAPGRDVHVVQVRDNGHAWPGGKPGSRFGDKPSTSYNATEAMWAFFKAHPKP